MHRSYGAGVASQSDLPALYRQKSERARGTRATTSINFISSCAVAVIAADRRNSRARRPAAVLATPSTLRGPRLLQCKKRQCPRPSGTRLRRLLGEAEQLLAAGHFRPHARGNAGHTE